MAATLAVAVLAIAGDVNAQNVHKKNSSGSGSGKSSTGGGNNKPSSEGSGSTGKLNSGGGNTGKLNSGNTEKLKSGNTEKLKSGNTVKLNTGNAVKLGTNNSGKLGSSKTGTGNLNKGMPGKPGNTTPGQGVWVSATNNGWNKTGWNGKWNLDHSRHHYGYWENGIWILPWVISHHEPWFYLQPATPIVSGRKWLGVTYAPYDGGGAYVSGIYQGSPAQQVGLEVGDVIASIDGRDATDLGSAIQAANDVAQLQVLSGRTGDLVEGQVNLIVP